MVDDNTIKEIIQSLPPKPARSKLEPYAKLILELHRGGRSFREIVRVLSESCDFKTSRSAVNDFVRARLKKKEKPQKNQRTAKPSQSNQPGLIPGKRQEIEHIVTEEDIQRRIFDLKKQQPKKETPAQLFEYDPDQPLQLPHKK
jgi:hypothetical protein